MKDPYRIFTKLQNKSICLVVLHLAKVLTGGVLLCFAAVSNDMRVVTRGERQSRAKHTRYALKEINISYVREGFVDELQNEVEILRSLDHPNVLKLYETFLY